ncbi:hypothetical protein BGX27_001119 [Mortierella sp. AM989]|nr:hypothetical protein BGX27_001119 [Mortierella sp. AM989]
MSLGKRSNKQWRFLGQEVTKPEDLTPTHTRIVYGLGPSIQSAHTNTMKANEETNSNDCSSSPFPYCGNRYANSGVEIPGSAKGNSACTATRCKDGNPHCLNYMGQDQWEKEDAFDNYFAMIAEIKPNPEVLKRPTGIPAGMKNLGATCYANSLLQVWFHDLAFRDAIYRCRFKEDSENSMNALYQLQLLFVHLDHGLKCSYNPLSLITSLKLDTAMQQDAQEFCNLFMAMIDNQLQIQQDSWLREFIRNQFQGHYSYNTTCKNCQRTSIKECTFYELMLNIKDNCTLLDCLEEFVEPEELVGADRYSCYTCGSLQDASREIKIDKLPNALNIQLMRFVYDNTTWTKKKSKDTIRFPQSIDFSTLLRSAENVVYDLSAVLVHSGPSAHSGHFMAHVLNRESNKWFVLNDEEVTEFHGTSFDPEDYSKAASKAKTAKAIAAKVGDMKAEKFLNTLSSRNAYMLTYVKRASERLSKPSSPPNETLELVLQDNAKLELELKEWAENGLLVAPHRIDKLYTLMHRRDMEEFERKAKGVKSPPAVWVSKAWITEWLKVSPRFHPIHGTTTDDPSPVFEAYISDVLCLHSRLSSDKSKRKLINKAARVLTRIFGEMCLPESDAVECSVCRGYLQPQLDNVKDMVARAASEKSELSGLLMRGERFRQIEPTKKYYAISKDGFMKKWLAFVKRPSVNMRPIFIDNSSLLCKHGQFLFDLGNQVDSENHDDDLYVINEEEWEFFQAMYGGGPNVMITVTEVIQADKGLPSVQSVAESSPSLCSSCRNERILDFSSTTFLIRVYSSGKAIDEDGDSTEAPPSTESSEITLKVHRSTKSSTTKRKQAPPVLKREIGARRSKRVKATKKEYKEIKVHVSKWDTVMDLKLRIMQKTDIVPLYQRLLHNKVELEKNESTISDLEIPPNAILDLFAFDQSMDDLDLSNFQDIVSTPGDEGGFGGTGLTEGWLD